MVGIGLGHHDKNFTFGYVTWRPKEGPLSSRMANTLLTSVLGPATTPSLKFQALQEMGLFSSLVSYVHNYSCSIICFHFYNSSFTVQNALVRHHDTIQHTNNSYNT